MVWGALNWCQNLQLYDSKGDWCKGLWTPIPFEYYHSPTGPILIPSALWLNEIEIEIVGKVRYKKTTIFLNCSKIFPARQTQVTTCCGQRGCVLASSIMPSWTAIVACVAALQLQKVQIERFFWCKEIFLLYRSGYCSAEWGSKFVDREYSRVQYSYKVSALGSTSFDRLSMKNFFYQAFIGNAK